MNPQPTNSDDAESLRKEIQAAIAAGREVGPEMDQHLADSVLTHYQQEQAARQRALQRHDRARAPQQPGIPGEIAHIIATNVSASIVAIVGILAFVAILVWQPNYWWVIFLLPWLLGALGWNRRIRNRRGQPTLPCSPDNQIGPPTTATRNGQDIEIL